jgi:hypothetical protein
MTVLVQTQKKKGTPLDNRTAGAAMGVAQIPAEHGK